MEFDTTELKEGEVFIGNTSRIDDFPRPELKGLKTIRMGQQAYDIKGEIIDTTYCRPVFIHKSEMEFYDRIMTDIVKK